jgi:ABC-type sugar transport system substrate-binding protein
VDAAGLESRSSERLDPSLNELAVGPRLANRGAGRERKGDHVDRLRKLSLFLPDPGNDFVQALAADATEAARRRGFTLTTYASQNQAVEQIQQIFSELRVEGARPRAVLVMPVHDGSLERVARYALGNGVGWVCLHRATGDLEALRREFPDALVALFGPEQEELGRIQARQLLAMFPPGARVLYVHGRADNQSTRQREAGFREVLTGSTVGISDVIDGNWSASDAERALGRWLRLLVAQTPVQAVVCQNDAMAIGARRALLEVARDLGRPALAQLPVLGCDGLPQVGRKLVDDGELAATIVLPMASTPAIDAVADAIDGGRRPAPWVRVQPQPYPASAAPRFAPPAARAS